MLAVHDGPAMHTKPFVPWTAVSQPLGVSTKTDASFEMPSGAALRASAIAASRSIKYCESGSIVVFFFQAEDGIRDLYVNGVQTCALPILRLGLLSGFEALRSWTPTQRDMVDGLAG